MLSSIRMCNGISSYTHPCIPNQFIHLLKLTRLGNLDSGTGCTLGSSEGFDQFNQFEASSNLAKDDVGSIQPICDNCGDEELRAISGSRWAIMPSINGSNLRARASIGHREETGSVVLQLEILVGEGFAVNRSTAGALFILDVTTMYKKWVAYISAGEVTTLQHELRDHTVERASLVPESLFTGAKGAKVLCGSRCDVRE